MTNAIKHGLIQVRKFAPVAAAVATGAVYAAAPDLAPLTDEIDFSTVVAAVLAVGVALLGIYIAIKGAKTVISMIRGG